MKRTFLQKVLCLLTAVMLAVGFALPACALHNWASSYVIHLDLENVPEDAVYADILVPAKNFGINEFAEFHETKITDYDKPAADIDKNSEIVNYIDDDGFISLSAHSEAVVHIHMQIFRNKELGRIIGGDIILKEDENKHDAGWLKRHYEEVKIAFVDKNGKVLSVTDKASFNTVIDQENPEMVSKDSKALKFGTHKYVSSLECLIIMLMALFVLAAFIAMTVAIIKGVVKSIRWNRKQREINCNRQKPLDKE